MRMKIIIQQSSYIIINFRLVMSFLICQKHNKIQKVPSKVPTNAFICLNRYCPNSFKIFCGACKSDHRDHSIKILSLEDITFLTERLITTPFVQVSRFVSEAVDVMKKLKLIKQFRKKIDLLERQIQKQALKLIEYTEQLIHEYANCKQNVVDLSEMLADLNQPKAYQTFAINSKELLSNIDYNFKKDKFQYYNSLIREKDDKRKKSFDSSKRKIEEVKDYTMKIIQVILHNNDSDDDEEDLAYTKKHYQFLKKEVCLEKNELELDEEISDLKNSKSTANRSRIKRAVEDGGAQTQNKMLSQQQANEELELRLQEMRYFYQRIENDLRLKISIIAKEKENSNKQIGKIKIKYEQKRKHIGKLQQSLRQKLELRQEKEKERLGLFQKIVELTASKSSIDDRFD